MECEWVTKSNRFMRWDIYLGIVHGVKCYQQICVRGIVWWAARIRVIQDAYQIKRNPKSKGEINGIMDTRFARQLILIETSECLWAYVWSESLVCRFHFINYSTLKSGGLFSFAPNTNDSVALYYFYTLFSIVFAFYPHACATKTVNFNSIFRMQSFA